VAFVVLLLSIGREYKVPLLSSFKLPLAGKRIFIRLRQETDYRLKLYEEVAAIVPEPELPTKGRKSPIPFEAPS
jgi:hypothetical protein